MSKYFMIFIALFGCYGQQTEIHQICDTSSLTRPVEQRPVVIDFEADVLSDTRELVIIPLLGHGGQPLNVLEGDSVSIHTEINCHDENEWDQITYVNDILTVDVSNVVGRECSSLSEITISIEPRDAIEITELCF